MQLTERDLSNLSECVETLQIVFKGLANNADFLIYEGHRGKEEQDKYFKEGKSKVKFPNSKHNTMPSKALDVIVLINGKPQWDNTEMQTYFAGQVIGYAKRLYEEGAVTQKIRWGGDWDRDGNPRNETFRDLVHFEVED
jgi:peptidoglycan L-alanyl-D-glutamate endopeptidase CwlK